MTTPDKVFQVQRVALLIREGGSVTIETVESTKQQLGGKVWSWLPLSEIEDSAMKQITNISTLPCTVQVAVMPDAHTGYGMPIGAVLATKDAVVPYAVGVDIGCGMIAVKTDIDVERAMRSNIVAALDGIFNGVPVGQPTKANRNSGSHTERQNSEVLRRWADDRGHLFGESNKHMRDRADYQLGTLGGGNHFIELQSDGAHVWLMLHTGSRGFGKAICDHYHRRAVQWCGRYYTPLVDKDLAFLSTEHDDGRDYLIDMGFAMRYATESRKRIEAASLAAMEAAWGPFNVEHRLETHHNFAAVEKHMGKTVVVHRKGAVSTEGGVEVTIPGSMQTGSYIARGIENALALNTCSHGAGRRLGRNETKRQNEGVDIRAEMESQGIVLRNPEGSDALDEAARAYKDIESVMRYQRDLAEPLVHLTPLGVVKG